MNNNPTPEKHNLIRSRLKLVLIFSLFLGPLLGAFFWYYGLGATLFPKGKSNHAPLLSPLVTLAPFQNDLFEQGSISFESLKHIWTIVHLSETSCAQDCQKSLYNTRQTRLALGKNADRVQRYIIVTDPTLANQIQQNHADATLVKHTEKGIGKQLRQIIKQHNLSNDDALLIDPLGNVMMIIPATLPPKLLLKDLKKLLKVSRIG